MEKPTLGIVKLRDSRTGIAAPELIAFLNENFIPIGLANRFMVELDCEKEERRFKALGFPNPSGKYEVIGPEGNGRTGTLTYTLWSTNAKEINLFNNQLDFLTAQKVNLDVFGDNHDSLIAANRNQLERALPELARYEKVNCYFDHTIQGRELAERVSKAVGDKMVDVSKLFAKDFSYHNSRVKASKNFEQFLEKKRTRKRGRKL